MHLAAESTIHHSTTIALLQQMLKNVGFSSTEPSFQNKVIYDLLHLFSADFLRGVAKDIWLILTENNWSLSVFSC